MSLYRLIRPLLMQLDEEDASKLVLKVSGNKIAKRTSKIYRKQVPKLPVNIFGKTFANPVGLAPGLDKDGLALTTFSNFGFGFIEVGTVTPLPQSGNPRPRVFRIVEDEAIVNRLGFNNNGLQKFEINLRHTLKSPLPSLIGINIGANQFSAKDDAIKDYVRGLEAFYLLADYIVINISSPNTKGLRDLQLKGEFEKLLSVVMEKRLKLASNHDGRKTPISIKVAPDLEQRDLLALVEVALQYKVDAITATNSTIMRPPSLTHKNYDQSGGLSGRPLAPISNRIIEMISEITQGSIPIIGVGGVSSAEDAWQKFLCGADLVQLCSALVYTGPSIVKKIVVGLADRAKKYDALNFSTAVKLAREQQNRASSYSP